jgi:hypothetical protein
MHSNAANAQKKPGLYLVAKVSGEKNEIFLDFLRSAA